VEIIFTVKSKADQSVRNLRHPVNGRMVLGRGPDSVIPLEAPGISREHLEVRVEDSSLYLVDLSSNGTWLNGDRMPPRRACRVGDTDSVELPGYELGFQIATAAAATSAAATIVSKPANSSPARSALGPAKSRSSFLRSFTPLEIFLFLIVLASLALLLFYISSQ
jgi:predicted component of type VI protein secretion system